MKHSCFYLFGLAHIPEVLAQITTGSSGYVHLIVILVTALWTLPFTVIVDDDLTVISAYVTVVGFGVELCILDVVVDVPYDFCQSIQIVPHVRYLNI